MEEKPNKDALQRANNNAATTLVNGDAGDQFAGPTDKDHGYATGMFICEHTKQNNTTKRQQSTNTLKSK